MELHDPTSSRGSKLNSNSGNLFLDGALVVAQLLQLEQLDSESDIQLYIHCPIGQVDSTLAIYDTMQLVRPNVATTCIGVAGGCGALLLAGGSKGKRSALPNGRVILRRLSAGVQGTEADIEVQAREIIRMQSRFQEIFAYHTGKPAAQIARDMSVLPEYVLTATQAVEYGLADSIVGGDSLLKSPRFEGPGLVDRDGLPLTSDSDAYESIVLDVRTATRVLVARIASSPQLLYQITPRQFEEVVAELLERQGYQVTLTPATHDGGKDLYVAHKSALGSFLYVVECKRYAPSNPVGVGLVRQLYGVVQQERATAGILATTSYFTPEAKAFQERIAYQLALKDFWDLTSWLTCTLTD